MYRCIYVVLVVVLGIVFACCINVADAKLKYAAIGAIVWLIGMWAFVEWETLVESAKWLRDWWNGEIPE